jgi:hypothetical protein
MDSSSGSFLEKMLLERQEQEHCYLEPGPRPLSQLRSKRIRPHHQTRTDAFFAFVGDLDFGAARFLLADGDADFLAGDLEEDGDLDSFLGDGEEPAPSLVVCRNKREVSYKISTLTRQRTIMQCKTERERKKILSS